MEKSEKEAIIKDLHDRFSRAKTAIAVEFAKVNVDTVTRLRKKFRDGKVEYKVLKNTLTAIAAREVGYAELESVLQLIP